MRVHSTFNNTLSVHEKASQQAEKGAIIEGEKNSGAQSKSKVPDERPPKERLSRGQILARIKEHKKAAIEEAKASQLARQAKLEAEQAQQAEKAEKSDKSKKSLTRPLWDKQVEEDSQAPKEVKTAEEAEKKAKDLTGKSEGDGIKVIDTQEEAVGDVGKNKPDDPMTRSKLKDVLSAGTFQFSEKERAALGEILGEDKPKK